MHQRPPLHPAWYLVASAVVALVAGLVIMYIPLWPDIELGFGALLFAIILVGAGALG
jgi:hypothetical protein